MRTNIIEILTEYLRLIITDVEIIDDGSTNVFYKHDGKTIFKHDKFKNEFNVTYSVWSMFVKHKMPYDNIKDLIKVEVENAFNIKVDILPSYNSID